MFRDLSWTPNRRVGDVGYVAFVGDYNGIEFDNRMFGTASLEPRAAPAGHRHVRHVGAYLDPRNEPAPKAKPARDAIVMDLIIGRGRRIVGAHLPHNGRRIHGRSQDDDGSARAGMIAEAPAVLKVGIWALGNQLSANTRPTLWGLAIRTPSLPGDLRSLYKKRVPFDDGFELLFLLWCRWHHWQAVFILWH